MALSVTTSGGELVVVIDGLWYVVAGGVSQLSVAGGAGLARVAAEKAGRNEGARSDDRHLRVC